MKVSDRDIRLGIRNVHFLALSTKFVCLWTSMSLRKFPVLQYCSWENEIPGQHRFQPFFIRWNGAPGEIFPSFFLFFGGGNDSRRAVLENGSLFRGGASFCPKMIMKKKAALSYKRAILGSLFFSVGFNQMRMEWPLPFLVFGLDSCQR